MYLVLVICKGTWFEVQFVQFFVEYALVIGTTNTVDSLTSEGSYLDRAYPTLSPNTASLVAPRSLGLREMSSSTFANFQVPEQNPESRTYDPFIL